MERPILGIAQNFTSAELFYILSSKEHLNFANQGFVGLRCSACGKHANVAVSYRWTLTWVCICGENNPGRTSPSKLHNWRIPWDEPNVGPERQILNLRLSELGFRGQRY